MCSSCKKGLFCVKTPQFFVIFTAKYQRFYSFQVVSLNIQIYLFIFYDVIKKFLFDIWSESYFLVIQRVVFNPSFDVMDHKQKVFFGLLFIFLYLYFVILLQVLKCVQ